MIGPIPTPAASAGWNAVRLGAAALLLLLVAAGFYAAHLQSDDPNLTKPLVTFGQIFVGLSLVLGIAGILAATLGYTRLMNGVPDPGLKWVLIGFAVSATPLVGVALYAVVPGVVAKVAK